MELDTIRGAVIASEELNFDTLWPDLANRIDITLAKLNLPKFGNALRPIIKASFMGGVEMGLAGVLEYLIEEEKKQKETENAGR